MIGISANKIEDLVYVMFGKIPKEVKKEKLVARSFKR